MGEWSNDGELREGKEEGAVGAVGWTARAEVGWIGIEADMLRSAEEVRECRKEAGWRWWRGGNDPEGAGRRAVGVAKGSDAVSSRYGDVWWIHARMSLGWAMCQKLSDRWGCMNAKARKGERERRGRQGKRLLTKTTTLGFPSTDARGDGRCCG
jgi:hypothetical protein